MRREKRVNIGGGAAGREKGVNMGRGSSGEIEKGLIWEGGVGRDGWAGVNIGSSMEVGKKKGGGGG